jgi:hypothetical protein
VIGARPERIRAELNIEKWPAIWNPTHSKTRSRQNPQTRTLERESQGPDGTRTVSKVVINPIAHLGDLTTDDQRTLYALIKHWEERGKPPHETPFSIRNLARLLHKKWGTNVIDSVTGSLERLRGTMLVWTRSYRSKDQRVEDFETIYVNILSKLKIIRRKVDGHVTTEAGYFQFDDHILKNLLENYTKPFLFDVFIEIKGEIALKLYSYLDLIMADKPRFERCTRELFEDLGLNGASYRNPSKRRQNLLKAFDELTGIMLTTGVLRSATIEKTKDGKDYKAVFVKSARAEFANDATEPTTRFAATKPVVVNDYSKAQDQSVIEAEEVVRFFHKTLHGVENHQVQSKELGQALRLVSQHGIEQAKFVVEFAADRAPETNFKPQHFGAVLSYASRALAAFSRRAARASVILASPDQGVQEKRCERGERLLGQLSPEQHDRRFQRARAELFREQPFLGRVGKQGSSLVTRSILTRMVRQLEDEPMNLMNIDPAFPARYPWLFAPAQNLPL